MMQEQRGENPPGPQTRSEVDSPGTRTRRPRPRRPVYESPIRFLSHEEAQQVETAKLVVTWAHGYDEDDYIFWISSAKVLEYSVDDEEWEVSHAQSHDHNGHHPFHDWLYTFHRGLYSALDTGCQMERKYGLREAGWDVRGYRREDSWLPAYMVFDVRRHIHHRYYCGSKLRCAGWAAENKDRREHLVHDTPNDREFLDGLEESA